MSYQSKDTIFLNEKIQMTIDQCNDKLVPYREQNVSVSISWSFKVDPHRLQVRYWKDCVAKIPVRHYRTRVKFRCTFDRWKPFASEKFSEPRAPPGIRNHQLATPRNFRYLDIESKQSSSDKMTDQSIIELVSARREPPKNLVYITFNQVLPQLPNLC